MPKKPKTPPTYNVYRCMIAPLYRDKESGRCFETQRDVQYTGTDNIAEVVVDGLRWALEFFKNLFETYEWECIGCIKISCQSIGPIEADGRPAGRNGMSFFEWKCDYPEGHYQCYSIEHTDPLASKIDELMIQIAKAKGVPKPWEKGYKLPDGSVLK